MSMSMHELDAEIGEIETRIAAERVQLGEAIDGCTNSLRDTVSSPKTLLALTGVGFALGKVMFGHKKPVQHPVPAAAKKAGVLGMLTGVAGTAVGLIQPKFGVGTLAKWAAKRYWAKKHPKTPVRAAPARPRGGA